MQTTKVEPIHSANKVEFLNEVNFRKPVRNFGRAIKIAGKTEKNVGTYTSCLEQTFGPVGSWSSCALTPATQQVTTRSRTVSILPSILSVWPSLCGPQMPVSIYRALRIRQQNLKWQKNTFGTIMIGKMTKNLARYEKMRKNLAKYEKMRKNLAKYEEMMKNCENMKKWWRNLAKYEEWYTRQSAGQGKVLGKNSERTFTVTLDRSADTACCETC